ncbi:MAG: EAL domain-containing protein, partial [Chloroflexi bacterium]|nr:EAL domain-containing protein [Chloroflexota bacterium]
MATPLRVLILEDRPDDAELMVSELKRAGLEPRWQRVEDESEYVDHLDAGLDLILADYTLPQFDAPRALQLLQARGLDVPFIVVSGTIGEELAVECLRRGAADYLLKDRLARLGPAVAHALEQRQLRLENRRAEEALRVRERAFHTLHELAVATSGVLDAAALARLAVVRARELLSADAAGLFWWDAEAGRLRRLAASGLPALEKTEITSGHGIVGLAFQQGAPVVVEHYPDWEHATHWSLAHGIQSAASVPLLVGEHAIGALVVHTHTRRRFEVEQVQLLALLAAQVGPALEAARLHVESEQRRAELAASEARFRRLAENAPDVIYRYELRPQRGFSYVSPAVARILGYTPEELCADPDLVLRNAYPEDVPLLASRAAQASSEPAVVRWRHKDGHTVWIERHNVPVYDAEGKLVANEGIARDITARRQAEEALEHQALYDTLTDLPNRTLLHDRLHQALLAAERDGRPLALLVMDVDRFEEVNETLGQHAGDLVLQQVGQRLRAALRATDTVARVVGDEFAVLLPATDAQGAILAASKLQGVLEPPCVVDGHHIDVGASTGIALYLEHGQEAETLLRRADVALSVAKRTGSGYAIYAPEQDQHSPGRLELVGELRQAIEQGQLRLHYQPKVGLKRGRGVGVESLVRWQHPERGLVPPDQFIPLAEQTGLIKPLTEWVLGTALRQCQAWRQAGLPLSVAVNLSMRNLHDSQLPETIAELLAASGLPPAWLELELTESAIMADAARALESLRRLCRMGVRIAIDDFGTGYSSLSYLKRLPVGQLKV